MWAYDAAAATGGRIVSVLPYFGVWFFGLLLAKYLYDKTTSYNFNEQLTSKDNPAFGLHLALYYIGVTIAMAGASFGAGAEEFNSDILNVAIYTVIAIVLIRASIWVNDKAVLPHFCIQKEMITDRNLGTAFVVGGSCVATGLVINGALSGESATFTNSLRDLVIYWGIGQAALIVGSLVFQKITDYDIHKVIEDDDNAAAGLSFGGFLVGIGIIIRSGLMGASSVLGEEIITTLVMVAFGTGMLCITRIIVDKAFLPASSLSHEVANDKNAGAGAVAAAVFVCLSIAFASAMAIANPVVSAAAAAAN